MEFSDVWSFQPQKIAENSEFNPGDICTVNDDQGNERHVLFGYHNQGYDKKIAQVFMISPSTEHHGPLDLRFDSPFSHVIQTDVTSPVFTSQLKKTQHRLKDEDLQRLQGFLQAGDLNKGGNYKKSMEYAQTNGLQLGESWDPSGNDARGFWKDREISTIRAIGRPALSHILNTLDN